MLSDINKAQKSTTRSHSNVKSKKVDLIKLKNRMVVTGGWGD